MIRPYKPQPKFNNNQVLQIRESYWRYKVSMQDLAKKHKVSKALIQYVVHGTGAYKDIKDNLEEYKEGRLDYRRDNKRQQEISKQSFYYHVTKPIKTEKRMKHNEAQARYRVKTKAKNQGINDPFHYLNT